MTYPQEVFAIPEPTYQRLLEVYNDLYDLSFELATARDEREEADQNFADSPAGMQIIAWLDDLQDACDALESLERDPHTVGSNLD